MKRKTPTALGRRDGGSIVQFDDDFATPNRLQSQPPEWLRISPYAQPAVLAAEMLEKASAYDFIPGLETQAAVYRSWADLIRRGCYTHARPR
jgi:hypothetical protein